MLRQHLSCRSGTAGILAASMPLLLALLPLQPVLAAPNPPSGPPAAFKPAADHLIQWQQQNQVFGMAAAMYVNGRMWYLRRGMADLDDDKSVTRETLFEIGSVTKAFTATLFAEQVRSGKMGLKDNLAKYFPELTGTTMGAATLEELATHTSGLPDNPPGLKVRDRPNFTTADLLKLVAGWKPPHPPGTAWSYSNIGYGLLGDALEKATGTGYYDLAKQQILTPLGMSHTTIEIPADAAGNYAQGYLQVSPVPHWPKNAWPAGGALRSTIQDMGKFLRANLQDDRDAPPELLQAMQLAQQGDYRLGPKRLQGLAWTRLTTEAGTLVSKDGATSGFSTWIGFIPEKKIGLVLMVNEGKADVAVEGKAALMALAANQ